MSIKIIDYKAGNAPSVMHAISKLGFDAGFARSPQELSGAKHIILPGVGSAGATMDSLREMNMLKTLEEIVLGKQALFLGICVGMQILFEHSAEGDVKCLGWLKGNVVGFDRSIVRVPQMGWNKVHFVKNTQAKEQDGYFYFVNSYYAKPSDEMDKWAYAEYPEAFTAAVQRDNIYATQFHLEKSGQEGLKLLGGFLKIGR